MQEPSSQNPKPVVFFDRCRPRGYDLIDLALAERKVFVGYPPWTVYPAKQHEWGSSLLDVRVQKFDNTDTAAIKEAVRAWRTRPQPDVDKATRAWTRRVAGHRNLAQRIGPGSYAIIPRMTHGVCHVGRVSAPFGLHKDDSYVSRAFSFKGTYDGSDQDFFGDIVQAWSVEAWVEVPLINFPAWIRTSLHSRSTTGVIGDKNRQSAWNVLHHLYKFGGGRSPSPSPSPSPTSDPHTVLQLLRDRLTPTDFEYVMVELMQLEHGGRWLHVGGTGDGGVDAVGYDCNGKPFAVLQCKLAWHGKVSELSAFPSPLKAYVALLDKDGHSAQPKTIFGLDVADLLIRHRHHCPMGTSLGLVECIPPRTDPPLSNEGDLT